MHGEDNIKFLPYIRQVLGSNLGSDTDCHKIVLRRNQVPSTTADLIQASSNSLFVVHIVLTVTAESFWVIKKMAVH
jgi:hypothetical protein